MDTVESLHSTEMNTEQKIQFHKVLQFVQTKTHTGFFQLIRCILLTPHTHEPFFCARFQIDSQTQSRWDSLPASAPPVTEYSQAAAAAARQRGHMTCLALWDHILWCSPAPSSTSETEEPVDL